MPNGGNPAVETKISYKILKIILYALLLTPLWVWSVFLFPFITSKVLYFRILVEIAAVIYIVLALKYPEIRPRRSMLTFAVWVYLGVLLVTSIFGLNFSKSFWGTVERGEGIVTMLHFAAYFTILTGVLRNKIDWRKYFAVAVIVVTLTAIMGLGQLFCGQEGDGLCRFLPPTQGLRISATIGNAAFFAALLLFGAFFAWYLAALSERKWEKWLFFAVGIFNAVILVQTQTRGGALGLYAGLFAIVIFYMFRAPRPRLRLASMLLAALMVVMPLLLFFKPQFLPPPIRDIAVVKRLSRITKFDTTTQSRLDTWQASITGWQDRPILGYGYENYNLAFNKYFPPGIFRNQGSQIWFDRAHNTVLDVMVASGVFGAAAYLAIFAFAAAILYRLRRKGSLPDLPAIILAALLLAYFVQNLFVFDSHATYLLFFLLLGYLVFLHSRAALPSSLPPRIYDYGYMPAAVLAGLAAVSLYFINLQPAAANYFTTMGIKSAKLQKYRAVSADFKKALSYGTYMDEEIRQRLVDYAHEAAGSADLTAPEKKELYDFVVAELEKNIRESPHDVKNYLYLMNVLNASSAQTGKVDQVFTLGEQALALSPARMQIYSELGQAAFLKGRPEPGLEYFRKAIELNPQPKESHFNYILAAILAKRPDIVEQEMKMVADLGHIFTVNDRAAIAGVYGQVCEIEQAREQVDETVKLQPGFAAQGQQFLADLEKKCQK